MHIHYPGDKDKNNVDLFYTDDDSIMDYSNLFEDLNNEFILVSKSLPNGYELYNVEISYREEEVIRQWIDYDDVESMLFNLHYLLNNYMFDSNAACSFHNGDGACLFIDDDGPIMVHLYENHPALIVGSNEEIEVYNKKVVCWMLESRLKVSIAGDYSVQDYVKVNNMIKNLFCESDELKNSPHAMIEKIIPLLKGKQPKSARK